MSRPWHRPNKCDCGKIPYRDEGTALAAAELRSEEIDMPLRAYKCPGTARWHIAARGFHPRALKSHARMLAWHLSARRVISRDALLGEFGLDPVADRGSSAMRKFNAILRAFQELELAKYGEPRPQYITAADQEGLRRVMAVGLEEYAGSRGFAVEHGRKLVARQD